MRYFEVRKPRIEIVPMIDIMLFLLVFFIMATLNMIPTSGLIGHLPTSSTAQSMQPAKVLIEMNEDGRLMIDQQVISLSDLPARLRPLAAGKAVVTIAGSSKVSMQRLAEVMDACRQGGITQIGLATRTVP